METIFKYENSERIIFHFNKGYLADPTIPMWVIKHKGITYYVDQVRSMVPFTTKNTPNNEHTKGSIMIKGQLLIYKEGNGNVCALIDFA